MHELSRNYLPIAICLLDASGVIHDLNSTAAELLGKSQQSLLHKTLDQFLALEDQDAFRQWFSQLGSVGMPPREFRIQRSDRPANPVQFDAGRGTAGSAEHPLYFVVMMESLTLRSALTHKSSLVFQSALLDSIGEAVIATDLPGRILYWNKAAEAIYGWKVDEVLGLNIINITTVEENKELGLEIMAALQEGKSWSGEFLVRHRDGHHFLVHVTDTCLRDRNGELSVIIGVSSDLTKRKQLEEQKRQLEAELYEQKRRMEAELYEQKLAMMDAEKVHLQEASRFKSEFIANMSHEIRTPLAVIRGYAEILAEEGNGPGASERIQSILRASRQVEILVNDILDISKIEAGKMDVELLPTDVATILNDIKDMLEIKAIERNVKLQIQLGSSVPRLIQTDPIRLKQILLNLIGNAIKFTHQGEVSIQVSMLPSAAHPLLSFRIRDTGIGMTPEQSQKIFGAYSQADPSITRKYGGTGLGLSLSLKLAKLLGGDLVLEESAPGRGSIFHLTIHAGAAMERLVIQPLKDASGSPNKKLTRPEVLLSGLRVLVAEDAADIRAIVCQILQKQRAIVIEAVNGEEAVQLVRDNSFDAVLMDLQMPVCDGFQATRRLRAEGYAVPIFALTAHAMAGERERCLAAGFSGYLTKPINFKEMISVLSQLRNISQDALQSNGR
ncbi:MAG TPA: PAS domain S-box protein [Oligoflexus sp.]|uniref:PAS domain S-box protein n=1 Tax=Oligoflexus sp. TaxID=1971216 RepID=UPI002D7EF7A4|nr:PAS domain S-box protein [Oligoflexus sp.]HET9236737.1 PAS domain S-box protein [Oligoflexus sp.]